MKFKRAFHHDQSRQALHAAQQLLQRSGAPCRAHTEVGDKATVIAALATRLRCDRIVLGTAHKSALLRLIESSTTRRVLELTPVPVVVIAGAAASPVERHGVSAGVGTALATLVLAAAERNALGGSETLIRKRAARRFAH